jgi:RNA polymerase sigma-70 factor, ECF subfamily
LLATQVASNQDRAAFGELYDYFAPRLTSYLIRLNLERGPAEELTQEVMLVLWQKAHLFDAAKSSLSTWLFRVARNRRIDLKRRDRSALLDPEDPVFQPEAPEAADTGMDARQRDTRIRLAMAELPDEQRELIVLAFFNGLSHSEIAERAALPLGTVKSRIRLAFARLRKAIEVDEKIDVD